jgi:hypothetical protein
VKGKAVEDSQKARQEVLLPAYRVTSGSEAIGSIVSLLFADYSFPNSRAGRCSTNTLTSKVHWLDPDE